MDNEIESRIININSSNASIKNNSTFNSDVVFKFPGLVKANQDYIKKFQFQLLDACIPVSFYNVNYTNNVLIFFKYHQLIIPSPHTLEIINLIL